jgi:hypothetical protein
LAILPGTRMPGFWPPEVYPKSYYPPLGGNADAQMLAIRDHLMTLKGGPSPRKPGTSGTTLVAGSASSKAQGTQ